MLGNSQNQYVELNHEIARITDSEIMKCRDLLYSENPVFGHVISSDKIVSKRHLGETLQAVRILKSLHSGTKTYTQNVINQLSCGGDVETTSSGISLKFLSGCEDSYLRVNNSAYVNILCMYMYLLSCKLKSKKLNHFIIKELKRVNKWIPKL